jgi:hypothetical protein
VWRLHRKKRKVPERLSSLRQALPEMRSVVMLLHHAGAGLLCYLALTGGFMHYYSVFFMGAPSPFRI